MGTRWKGRMPTERTRGEQTYRLDSPRCDQDWHAYHGIRRKVFHLPRPDEPISPDCHALLLFLEDKPIGAIQVDDLRHIGQFGHPQFEQGMVEAWAAMQQKKGRALAHDRTIRDKAGTATDKPPPSSGRRITLSGTRPPGPCSSIDATPHPRPGSARLPVQRSPCGPRRR